MSKSMVCKSKSKHRPFIIAIDGPSASGKSTLGRALARHFRYGYVDSGAVYRAVGHLAGQLGIEPSDSMRLTSAIRTAVFEIDSAPGAYCVTLNGRRLKDELRHPSVTAITMALATSPDVRIELTRILRRVSHPRGMVMDGRDVGTNIFPDADVKIFLEADPAARAIRRWRDEIHQGRASLQREIEVAIEERDRLDRERAANPLLKALDASAIETTSLSAEQVKRAALSIIAHARRTRKARVLEMPKGINANAEKD